MSDRAPWIRPAISFGLPVLALVIALPYVTGHGYSLPGGDALRRAWSQASGAVAHTATRLAHGDAPAHTVRFYECHTASGKVLSSSPCGPGARIHDVDPDAVNHLDAAPAPVPSPPVAGAALGGVRGQIAASQSVDARNRAAAEQDAQ